MFRHDGLERSRTPDGELISCSGSLTIVDLGTTPHQLDFSEIIDPESLFDDGGLA